MCPAQFFTTLLNLLLLLPLSNPIALPPPTPDAKPLVKLVLVLNPHAYLKFLFFEDLTIKMFCVSSTLY